MKWFIVGVILGITLYNVANAANFEKDIKPIVKTRCSSCHNAGWKDKNFLDKKVAKLNCDKIKLRVVDRKDMPPGNATNMSETERETFANWIKEGCK